MFKSLCEKFYVMWISLHSSFKKQFNRSYKLVLILVLRVFSIFCTCFNMKIIENETKAAQMQCSTSLNWSNQYEVISLFVWKSWINWSHLLLFPPSNRISSLLNRHVDFAIHEIFFFDTLKIHFYNSGDTHSDSHHIKLRTFMEKSMNTVQKYTQTTENQFNCSASGYWHSILLRNFN